MTARTYASPESFKQALEQRLRSSAGPRMTLVRRRQLLVFDRFLARLAAVLGSAVTLKGGLVLELRRERARSTKVVDLRLTGSPEGLLGKLQQAARLDLGDFLTFEIRSDPAHPTIQNDGMPYEGKRFRASGFLAGKPYADPFGVDIAFGDPILEEPEVVVADDVLSFAGIAPPHLRIYPVETHLAEKLHAYTLPRARPNTRVQDLPDLALLATPRALTAGRLHAALEQTFAFRKTHPLPPSLPAPLPAWERPQAVLAREDGLVWTTLADVTAAATSFLDPVLAGGLTATWDKASWPWRNKR